MDFKWQDLAKGLAVCEICFLIVAELYFKLQAGYWVGHSLP